MKLDRNINPDGKGKYALLNLRKNTIEWGNEPGNQFFVIKLKDRFAAPALKAYADAVREQAGYLALDYQISDRQKVIDSLKEYASEVDAMIKDYEFKSKNIPDGERL